MRTWKTDHGLAGNPMVAAPCCGRLVAADMLVNVAGFPPEKRPTPRPYACDACLERAQREGRTRPSEVAELLGAPLDKVLRLRAREARIP